MCPVQYPGQFETGTQTLSSNQLSGAQAPESRSNYTTVISYFGLFEIVSKPQVEGSASYTNWKKIVWRPQGSRLIKFKNIQSTFFDHLPCSFVGVLSCLLNAL